MAIIREPLVLSTVHVEQRYGKNEVQNETKIPWSSKEEELGSEDGK